MNAVRNMRLMLGVMLVACSWMPLFAQSKVDARISKIELREQKTPVFSEGQHGSRGGANRWCRIDVEFETKGRSWLNEVEARWLVMVNTDSLSKPASMSLNVTYTDVKEGKRSLCAYIPPKFFDRYMRGGRIDSSRINVYVELYANGQRIARDDYRGNRKSPDGWFRMTDSMQSFQNYLLPKYKTPFAS
ncbi:MAG: hypothetical protein IJS15_15250, partial [Victivallales bacterium]|nr:hypothetical protein [Victivallales bacterium]